MSDTKINPFFKGPIIKKYRFYDRMDTIRDIIKELIEIKRGG